MWLGTCNLNVVDILVLKMCMHSSTLRIAVDGVGDAYAYWARCTLVYSVSGVWS